MLIGTMRELKRF